MSRIENGVKIPRVRDVRDLCRLYGVDEKTTAQLTALVGASRESGWWEKYTELGEEYTTLIGLESAAFAITEYRGSTIPGLLQTAEYLNAYIRDAINPGRATPFPPDEIIERIEVARKRREILLPPTTVTYTAFLDEGCVRRPVGGNKIMTDQIDHVLSLLDLSHISIRLLPFGLGAHPGQPGGFCLVSLAEVDVSDVVYVDSLAGQLFLEKPDDLDRHRRVLAQLDKIALSLNDSRTALTKIKADFRTD
jgi:hypothetical protein